MMLYVIHIVNTHLSNSIIQQCIKQVTGTAKTISWFARCSADGWSSRANNGYISILVHFIPEGALTTSTLCLGVIKLDSAKADDLFAAVLPLFEAIHLPLVKLVKPTCDEGKNYRAMYSHKFGVDAYPCSAHSLNTAANKAANWTPTWRNQLFHCSIWTNSCSFGKTCHSSSLACTMW